MQRPTMQRPTMPPSLWREAVWRWSWTRGGRRGAWHVGAGGTRDMAVLEHSPQNINLLREMLRIDSLRRLQPNTGKSVTPLSPPPPLWLQDHLQDPHWRIPDLQLPLDRLPALLPAPSPAPRSPGPGGGWDTAARGWGAAALLLALIMMLVRLSEKCLDGGWFKSRRRRSVEWPTPSVLATSNQNNEITDEELEAMDPYSDHLNLDNVSTIDRPPPYSEVSIIDSNNGNDVEPKPYRDEPPPPYSACYVAFSNPKDGTPSVQFYSNRRQNLFEDANESNEMILDTGQNIVDTSIDIGESDIAGLVDSNQRNTLKPQECEDDELIINVNGLCDDQNSDENVNKYFSDSSSDEITVRTLSGNNSARLVEDLGEHSRSIAT